MDFSPVESSGLLTRCWEFMSCASLISRKPVGDSVGLLHFPTPGAVPPAVSLGVLVTNEQRFPVLLSLLSSKMHTWAVSILRVLALITPTVFLAVQGNCMRIIRIICLKLPKLF